jgi:glycosyltransferase involved in cell wall biosynthesis
MLDPWILAEGRTVKRIHATFLEKPALRKAHVHALTQSEYDSVIAYLPGVASRTFVVPNGVDATNDREVSDRSGFLYLGRLHAKKQVIELARLWRSAGTLSGSMLTIAGWGDAAYEKELAATVDGATNVRFIGPVYGGAKESALNSARFFILPSLSEGLPMAALEALQHGAIPLVTDQCNLPELFEAGVALRIATDLSDVTSIASAAAARPDGELVTLSQSGRAFSGRYLWSSIAEQMRCEYGAILEMSSS